MVSVTKAGRLRQTLPRDLFGGKADVLLQVYSTGRIKNVRLPFLLL